jgi:hypothetical protein
MTKQHIFIIENNLQKIEVIFSLVPSDNHDHWRQCDVRNFSYGHPKMEDADSDKN